MSRRHILMTGLRPPSLRGLAAALAAVALVPAGGLSAQDRAHATADRMRSEIHRAAIAGSDTAFADIVLFARRAVTAFPEDALINHYLGYALYRVAMRTLGDDAGLALEMLEESEAHLQRSIDNQPIAESHALLAVVLGMRIVDDETAMTLGMRSRVEMQKARRLDPANPRVRLLEGISAFHAPEVWGGGHESALVHFLAAADLFADDRPEPPLPDWGLAETHAWLGQTYAALGNVEEARGAYERALEEEPGYAWVRDTLLPGLAREDRQMGSTMHVGPPSQGRHRASAMKHVTSHPASFMTLSVAGYPPAARHLRGPSASTFTFSPPESRNSFSLASRHRTPRSCSIRHSATGRSLE